MAEVRINIKTVQDGGDNVPKINQGLKQTIGTVGQLTAGVAAAGLTIKKAFDLSKEGANLLQLEDSFNLLNESILETPDLLEDMQEASRGTLTETQLMEGVLKLVAGTSKEMAQELAAASPQLLEIAKAAQKLNPSLGDTAFLYESITTGIKRGSPLILDNLGIVVKVGEANERMAESLGKTVAELTAEEKSMALLNATLESGEQLITQVGGDVDSQADAWARLETQVQENTDAFKKYLAEGLTPVMQAASGQYGDTVEEIIDSNIAAAKSVEDLILEGQKLGGVGGFGAAITGTKDEIRAGGVEIARSLAAMSSSYEEFDAAIKDSIFGSAAGAGFQDHIAGLKLTTEEYYNLVQAGESVADSDRAMMNSAAGVAAMNNQVGASLEYGSDLADRYGASAAAAAEESRKLAFAFQAQNEANIAANAALVSGFQAAEEPIQAFLDAQKLSMESQGEWVQVTRTSAGEIADISEQLAGDLNDDQRKAWEEILSSNAEGGAEWLSAWKALQADLTDTQRAELIAQRADLEAAGDTIGSAYTGSIEDMQAAKDAAIAANQAIIESYQELALEGSLAIAEASPDPEAFSRALDYAVSIGAITEAERDMREEVANTRTAIEELNTMVVQGGLDAETAAKAYELLTTGEATAADEAVRLAEEGGKIGDGFLNSLPGIDEVINRLDSLDGRHVRTTVETSYVESGTPPPKAGEDKVDDDAGSTPGGGGMAAGGSVWGGQMYRVGEGNRPELLASGGSLFMIPGDKGQVFSNEDSKAMMGGITIGSVTIYAQPGQDGRQLAQEMIHELGRLTRQQMRGR